MTSQSQARKMVLLQTPRLYVLSTSNMQASHIWKNTWMRAQTWNINTTWIVINWQYLVFTLSTTRQCWSLKTRAAENERTITNNREGPVTQPDLWHICNVKKKKKVFSQFFFSFLFFLYFLNVTEILNILNSNYRKISKQRLNDRTMCKNDGVTLHM